MSVRVRLGALMVDAGRGDDARYRWLPDPASGRLRRVVGRRVGVDVPLPMLEADRRRLRGLLRFLDKTHSETRQFLRLSTWDPPRS
ncbi:MAG: hypothetical protein ACPGVG_08960 [Mycobacterium sp.]